MKLARCFVRYEPNIGDGTMFLFNKENGKMLEGDYYSYIIIRSLIDGVDLETLAKEISSENGWDIPDVQNDINRIVHALENNGFIKEDS